jgi:hypothetical protein
MLGQHQIKYKRTSGVVSGSANLRHKKNNWSQPEKLFLYKFEQPIYVS